MKYIFTDFYSKFSCIGGDCPDTCCAGWEIRIDEQAYNSYKGLPEPLCSEICGKIEEVEKEKGTKQYRFIMEQDGRCPFLNQENLCEIYIKAAPQALCRTCQTFPRKIVNFYDVILATVNASCPEVVRILLEKKEPISFGYTENEIPADVEGADWVLYNELINGLVISTDIMQDRRYPLWKRVHMLLQLTGVIQNHIAAGKLDVLRESIACYKDVVYRDEYMSGLDEAARGIGNCWHSIYMLLQEIDEMSNALGNSKATLQRYLEIPAEEESTYEQWMKDFRSIEQENELENLAIAFVFEYYMDALKGKSLLENVIKMALLLLYIRTGEMVDYQQGKLNGQKEKVLLISQICRALQNTKLLETVAARMIKNNREEELLKLAFLLQ